MELKLGVNFNMIVFGSNLGPSACETDVIVISLRNR